MKCETRVLIENVRVSQTLRRDRLYGEQTRFDELNASKKCAIVVGRILAISYRGLESQNSMTHPYWTAWTNSETLNEETVYTRIIAVGGLQHLCPSSMLQPALLAGCNCKGKLCQISDGAGPREMTLQAPKISSALRPHHTTPHAATSRALRSAP